MRPGRFSVFLVIAVWLTSLPAVAVPVENLYRADVEVADHSSRALQRAGRAGLAQVLVKISGSRAVLNSVEVKTALADNRRFLQRYQYHQTEANGLRLQIHYDSQLITELLTQAKQPLWTANRLPVLIWLVVDDSGGRRFGAADTHPQWMESLQTGLQRRGVPAVFPLQDLQDAMMVSIHDLWKLDTLAIYRASQRYAVGNILVGRLSAMSDGRWMGDWLYLQEGESTTNSFYGKALEPTSIAAIDFVAERMANRYAVVAGVSRGENVLIRVDNLKDYGAYRAVVQYLENIELVDSAYPAYIEGDSMVFRLRAQAEAEQLHRIIALSHNLRRQVSAPPLSGATELAQLVYRWNP